MISLIVIVGGDRGVVSLIALVGNLLLLGFAIPGLWPQEYRFYFLRLGGNRDILHYIILSKWNECKRPGAHLFLWLLQCWFYFFVIYVVIWSTEAGGLNEIQSVGDDILYYNMDLNISMRNVMVSVILLSTLGAILDMALTVTTSVYEVKIINPR